MSGVWTISGQSIATLEWEPTDLPAVKGWCAIGRKAQGRWPIVYWIIQTGRRAFALQVIDDDDERGTDERGVFGCIGTAQGIAEQIDSGVTQ